MTETIDWYNDCNICSLQYECCGVDDVRDWEERRNPLIPLPPRSCCQEEETCSLFYAKGCLTDLENYERRQLDVIAPIGLAFGGFQVSNSEHLLQVKTGYHEICLKRSLISEHPATSRM